MIYVGALLLAVASLMQGVILPQVVPLSARPHLIVLFVVAVCLVESLHEATIWAFVGGLMLDLMSGPVYPVGSNALILMFVALLSSLGQANPFHNKLLVPLVTVFAATVFYHVMILALTFALGHPVAFVDSVLRVALPSAILNTLLTPLFYTIALWLSERLGRRVRVEW